MFSVVKYSLIVLVCVNAFRDDDINTNNVFIIVKFKELFNEYRWPENIDWSFVNSSNYNTGQTFKTFSKLVNEKCS
jgi:hypothetical protein